jgi:hypothetical protein
MHRGLVQPFSRRDPVFWRSAGEVKEECCIYNRIPEAEAREKGGNGYAGRQYRKSVGSNLFIRYFVFLIIFAISTVSYFIFLPISWRSSGYAKESQ